MGCPSSWTLLVQMLYFVDVLNNKFFFKKKNEKNPNSNLKTKPKKKKKMKKKKNETKPNQKLNPMKCLYLRKSWTLLGENASF
jgi:hypothetical protein